MADTVYEFVRKTDETRYIRHDWLQTEHASCVQSWRDVPYMYTALFRAGSRLNSDWKSLQPYSDNGRPMIKSQHSIRTSKVCVVYLISGFNTYIQYLSSLIAPHFQVTLSLQPKHIHYLNCRPLNPDSYKVPYGINTRMEFSAPWMIQATLANDYDRHLYSFHPGSLRW